MSRYGIVHDSDEFGPVRKVRPRGSMSIEDAALEFAIVDGTADFLTWTHGVPFMDSESAMLPDEPIRIAQDGMCPDEIVIETGRRYGNGLVTVRDEDPSVLARMVVKELEYIVVHNILPRGGKPPGWGER